MYASFYFSLSHFQEQCSLSIIFHYQNAFYCALKCKSDRDDEEDDDDGYHDDANDNYDSGRNG